MATGNDVHSGRSSNTALEITDEEGNIVGSGSGVKFKVGGATTGRPLPPLEVSGSFNNNSREQYSVEKPC